MSKPEAKKFDVHFSFDGQLPGNSAITSYVEGVGPPHAPSKIWLCTTTYKPVKVFVLRGFLETHILV